ncbi:unnamed protein product [Adineta ricciae]|uniref:G-protein coupled receptors family 1 profile domain-containing protein n=1 Tax=Adineta ricciae TaxID=249248 RepID=A0A816ARU2_ADIRI|nr:unnamed protein product [Adineta ricciae]CAF1598435.1 unnamed protein product [Adineta ricciae]
MKANGSFDDSWLIIAIVQQSPDQLLPTVYQWSALFLLFFSIIGILGNLLVCLAIGTERRLHNPTNWYIFSLALADMLISGFVIPLATVKEFTGYWKLGRVVCDLWIFLDVCSCTSSIMHIVVISIDRYLAIEDPLKVRSRQKKYQICFFITVIWLMAIFLSSPMIVLGALNPYNTIVNGQCLINNRIFVIYGSVVSFVIPLIIVIMMYALTVRRLKKQIKQCQTHFAQEQIANTINLVSKPFLQQKATSQTFLNASSQSLMIPAIEMKRRRLQTQETSFDISDDGSNNISIDQNRSAFGKRNKTVHSFVDNDYTCPKNPFCELKCSCHQPKAILRANPSRKPRPTSLPVPILPHQSSLSSLQSVKRPHNRFLFISSLATNRTRSSAVRNEQKAVKVLGVVFVIFVIAWFPFCILNILRAVCKRCSINEHLLNGFVWLGYVSAAINPIVYTMFNRHFRSKFLALLKCQCLLSKRRREQLAQSQRHSSIQTSRIYRPNDFLQADMRRFHA